ncbi:MAG: transcription-repair coupling factor [Planctomycetes bacterium]|nr:transcription-repair coupling factor [Planctomycetota bacterium]
MLVSKLIADVRKVIVDSRKLGGMSGCGYAVAAAALPVKGRLLVVTPGPEGALDVALDLQALATGRKILQTPVAGEGARSEWVSLLAAIDEEKTAIIVAPAAAMLEALPAPGQLETDTINLKTGKNLDVDGLFKRLVESGMTRQDQVGEEGQFARRGGIVDVFPIGRNSPLRIELMGDEIESIRGFDVLSQRSLETLESIALLLPSAKSETKSNLLAYLDAKDSITAVDYDRIVERLSVLGGFAHDDTVTGAIKGVRAAVAGAFQLSPGPQAINLELAAPVALGEGYQGVAGLITAMRQSGRRVALFCGNEAEIRLATEGLKGCGLKAGADLEYLTGDLGGGRVFAGQGVAMLSLHELLGRARRRVFTSDDKPRELGDVMDDFLELEAGDYVVHLSHGIARYRGMETLERDGKRGEFLALEFDEGLMLHVPVANANVVQKYIGSRGEAPRLSKYNTAAWSEKKIRAQQSVLKLATDLLELQALRAQEAGHQCRPDTPEQAEFEAACPFRDTPDQARSTREIKRDMESRRPMDRLLCGDVGYGKTEVAMRAAVKMVQEGKQVAVLVPTTVLAQQHFMTFSERMSESAVMVGMLSRFRTDAQIRKTITQLAEGKLDVAIGTHRLLSNDVQFRDLGLVIIDEEQRFGVEAKEKLKTLRRTVDLLTLSATPIPRTLHQAMLGVRDISNLTTPPQERIPVQTKLMHWDDKVVGEAIKRELARDGQVFFVHNRVYDIEKVADRVRLLAPDARVEIGHGQMHEDDLEQVMLRFMQGKVDVLVCTTIIESGIDVRAANTMFIDDAHMYGLADLHQLRGRVGRFHNQAFCYLLVPADVSVPELAQKRLKAILQHSALGAGFKIAMRDLELRGAGNLLGPEQSGHIASIGYDLYCRLLERSVRKLKNQPVGPDIDTSLELGLDLQLPQKYVAAPRQRLEVHRKLARIRTPQQAEDLKRELTDRFGQPPGVIDTMLMAALVRARLSALGVLSIAVADGYLRLRSVAAPLTQKKLSAGSGSFRVLDEQTLALPLRKGLETPLDQLRFLSNLLQMLSCKGVLEEERPPDDVAK